MRRIQQKLKDEGLYNGKIDGIYGPDTYSALLAHFKIADIGSEQLSEHFKKSEFICKCNGRYCTESATNPTTALITSLENIRQHYNVPVVISSGYRCVTHNANVGGVWNSYHTKNRAADFAVKSTPAKEVVTWIKKNMTYTECYEIDDYYVHFAI